MDYFKTATDITRSYAQSLGYRHCIGCANRFIPAPDEPENGRFRDFCSACCQVISIYLGMEGRREVEKQDQKCG